MTTQTCVDACANGILVFGLAAMTFAFLAVVWQAPQKCRCPVTTKCSHRKKAK